MPMVSSMARPASGFHDHARLSGAAGVAEPQRGRGGTSRSEHFGTQGFGESCLIFVAAVVAIDSVCDADHIELEDRS